MVQVEQVYVKRFVRSWIFMFPIKQTVAPFTIIPTYNPFPCELLSIINYVNVKAARQWRSGAA